MEEANLVGGEGEGNEPWDSSKIQPSSPFTHPFPCQVKNLTLRNKVISGQDVDLHGVAKVGNQELIMGKRNGTQSNKGDPRIHKGRRN